jgi:hypothetical protein
MHIRCTSSRIAKLYYILHIHNRDSFFIILALKVFHFAMCKKNFCAAFQISRFDVSPKSALKCFLSSDLYSAHTLYLSCVLTSSICLLFAIQMMTNIFIHFVCKLIEMHCVNTHDVCDAICNLNVTNIVYGQWSRLASR